MRYLWNLLKSLLYTNNKNIIHCMTFMLCLFPGMRMEERGGRRERMFIVFVSVVLRVGSG